MSRNRERKQDKSELATVIGRVTPKIKKRPRGKPFEKGNTYSLPYRFKKNEPSANPGGRPKTRQFNAATRKFCGADIDNPPKIETAVDAVVAKGLRKALKGDLGWATFLANRAEGLPVQGLSIHQENDPLLKLVEHLDARSRQLGRPEGFIARQKVLEVGDGDQQ
jgi:hypothetical protein